MLTSSPFSSTVLRLGVPIRYDRMLMSYEVIDEPFVLGCGNPSTAMSTRSTQPLLSKPRPLESPEPTQDPCRHRPLL